MKKKIKIIFFQVQCCRYGVSDEYSSIKIFKKLILSRLKHVFSCFFLLAKNGFLVGFLIGLSVGLPLVELLEQFFYRIF